MKKYLLKILAILMIATFGVMMPVAPAYAADNFSSICDKLPDDPACQAVRDDRNLWTIVQGVIEIVLGLVGIITVIVIIVAGQRMATSAGDPGKLKAAKDMLTWGIIGLVIALMAYAIVNFVGQLVSPGVESGAGGAGTSQPSGQPGTQEPSTSPEDEN